MWGHAIGGMGAITQAMAKAAVTHGVDIRLATRVRRIIVEHGRAVGVETDEGEIIHAAVVAAGTNPKLLYLELVDALDLPEGFRRRMENWRCGSGTFRMNVALSELPDFTALPGRACAEHHASGILIAPSLAYMGARLFFDARSFGWSRRPIVELVIPFHARRHARAARTACGEPLCQHVAPHAARRSVVGRPSRNRRRSHDRHGRRIMRRTSSRSVLARQILSPLDLEQNVRSRRRRPSSHGALDTAANLLGAADAGLRGLSESDRGPLLVRLGTRIRAEASPARPGHNAAREILRDFRRKARRPSAIATADRRTLNFG